MKIHNRPAPIFSAIMFITLLALFGNTTLAAPLGTAFTYQGRLTDGTNVANGHYDFTVTIYDTLSSGSVMGGPVTNAAVAVANGLFTCIVNCGAATFTGEARWLEISLRTNGSGAFTTLAPRQPLTPSPYALFATSAGSAITAITASNAATGSIGNAALAVGAVNSSSIADGTIATADIATIDAGKIVGGDLQATRLNVGSAHILTGTLATIAGGLQNSATNTYTTVGGGQQNTASRNCATVAGGEQNTAAGSYSFVGGGEHNSAEAGVATVGGGSGNKARGLWCTVGGGYYNTASNETATVAGGNRNFAGAASSFVGGGTNNTIQYGASFSGIAGGYQNSIQTNALGVTIGGGYYNIVEANASYAAMGGGYHNGVGTKALCAMIGGGYLNSIQDNASYATIGGGYLNSIQNNASYATIGGGYLNSTGTNAFRAAIGGGFLNAIQDNGQYAMIPGGYMNSATNYAFAAGRQAMANHTGAFVWADSTEAEFASTTNDEFNVRAGGGVRLVTPYALISGAGNELAYIGGDGAGSDIEIGSRSASITNVGFRNSALGQHMNLYAKTFNPTSDRSAKERFTSVNVRTVLEKVVALPLTEWNFKGEAGTRHIGPVAQDFHDAFGLGISDKCIATVDADGVALAAIQGLNRKVEQKNAEIAELKQRVDKLEQLLTQKLDGGLQ